MDRDRSYVLNLAISAYLEVNQWQIEHIRKACARPMLENSRLRPKSPQPLRSGVSEV